MSVITVTDISVLDNPTEFSAPFQFQINFECLSALEDGEQPACFMCPSNPMCVLLVYSHAARAVRERRRTEWGVCNESRAN